MLSWLYLPFCSVPSPGADHQSVCSSKDPTIWRLHRSSVAHRAKVKVRDPPRHQSQQLGSLRSLADSRHIIPIPKLPQLHSPSCLPLPLEQISSLKASQEICCMQGKDQQLVCPSEDLSLKASKEAWYSKGRSPPRRPAATQKPLKRKHPWISSVFMLYSPFSFSECLTPQTQYYYFHV